jgi:hypothetical protein
MTMNRDESEAQRENTTTTELLARELSPKVVTMKGSSFVGATLAPQEAANRKISLATKNARNWTTSTVEVAFRAARPVAEDCLRSSGRVFNRNDVRQLARTYLASYVKTYGVLLPPGTRLGGSSLESMASDICGPLDVPLSLLPNYVQVPLKMAEKAPQKAKSWFARLFSTGPKATAAAPAPATPAAPATTPVAAVAPATPVATSGSSDSLGAATATTALEKKMLAQIVTAAKAGNPNAKAALLRLQKEGYAVSLGNDSSGDWLYQLNPLYWVKSAEQRKLIDKEREGWSKNAELQKQLAKRQEVLEQASKAQQAQLAVQAAQTRSAELEAQLKSIESQLSGMTEIMGDDSADVSDSVAPVLERVKKARNLNVHNADDLKAVASKMASGQPLTPTDSANVLQYLARNERLHEFRKSLVSGENYATNKARPIIQKNVVLGAMKAMTPTEQQMMVQIVKLAKSGNPNAQAALKKLQAQGYAVTMGDNLGFGISDAFSIATAPIKYGIVKPLQWTSRKLGITKGPSATPQQIRMQRLQAAMKRRQAAEARARAADAETDAERRVQEQVAAAAQAEADAADAQATAREAQMATEEAQYTPPPAVPYSADDSDQSGSDEAGKIEITPLPPTPPLPPVPTKADQLKLARRALVAKKNPRAAKILALSEQNTPQGKKLQASMAMYANAKKGSRKDRAAIINIVKRAKKGDKQARQDALNLKAAQLAIKADKRAGRVVAVVTAKNAANKKGIAIQRRLEASAAQTLVRRSRAKKLAKVAKIERKAAAGHKPSQVVIKRVVTKAKAGDKNAMAAAKAFKLAQTVRTKAPTRAERKKLIAAHKMVRKLHKGNKRSLAELRVLKAAAAHGNPNAKKALDKLKIAAATETALATGSIVLPAGVALTMEQKRKHAKKQRAMQKHVASVEAKVERGTASREEALKAASEANALGNKDAAQKLAAQATELPSAQDNLRRVATVASAAAAGSALSQEKIAKAQSLAETGDASGIAAMGQLAAVKALDDARQGKPMDPAMKVAVADMAKAEVGDTTAKAKIAEMQEQAKTGNSNAVKYMVYATGAAVVGRSLANNPAAQEEWQQKAGIKPTDTDNDYVETGKKPLSLELPPVASSLPDVPLEPIQGVTELIKESLKALFFATRDPVQNYREAVLSKARLLPAIDGSAGEEGKPSAKKPAALPAKKPAELDEVEEDDLFVDGEDKQSQLVSATKARLGKLVAAADKGDKEAARKWEIAKANYKKHKAAAAKGDDKSKSILAVLDATGLFTKL